MKILWGNRALRSEEVEKFNPSGRASRSRPLKDPARLGENHIRQARRERGADLRAQLLGLGLLDAAIAQNQIAFSRMQSLVPRRIDRSSKVDAPLRIQAAAAARDVVISQDHHLWPRLRSLQTQEVTDVSIARERSPVGRGRLGLVGRTKEHQGRTQFVRAHSKVIGPIGRVERPPVRGGESPGIFVGIVTRPDAEAQARLPLVIHAGNSLRLGLARAQRRQEQSGQDRDDRNHHQQLDQCKSVRS